MSKIFIQLFVLTAQTQYSQGSIARLILQEHNLYTRTYARSLRGLGRKALSDASQLYLSDPKP